MDCDYFLSFFQTHPPTAPQSHPQPHPPLVAVAPVPTSLNPTNDSKTATWSLRAWSRAPQPVPWPKRPSLRSTAPKSTFKSSKFKVTFCFSVEFLTSKLFLLLFLQQRCSVLVPGGAALPAQNVHPRGLPGAVARQLGHDGPDHSVLGDPVYGARAVEEAAAGGPARRVSADFERDCSGIWPLVFVVSSFQYQSAPLYGRCPGGNHVPVVDLSAGSGPRSDGGDGQVLRLPDTARGVCQDLAVWGPADAVPGLLGHHLGRHSVRRNVLLHVRYSQEGVLQ